jgi:hypothetical protein
MVTYKKSLVMLERRPGVYNSDTGKASLSTVPHHSEVVSSADITKFMIPYSKEYEKIEQNTNFADSFGREKAKESLTKRWNSKEPTNPFL